MSVRPWSGAELDKKHRRTRAAKFAAKLRLKVTKGKRIRQTVRASRARNARWAKS